jgi:hypothetical protein
VGVWLNPSLGNVTFSAFDSTLTQLESFTGNAGNFVGVDRPTNDIKFISIVAASATGFTVDDLTFAQASAPPPTNGVPEPSSLPLLIAALLAAAALRRRADPS